MITGILIGLSIGVLALAVQYLLGNIKLNEYRDAYLFDITEMRKDKMNEVQRADLLAKANEELQEDFNKTELKYNRLFLAHDSLRARIRKAGDARKYDLSVVERVEAA